MPEPPIRFRIGGFFDAGLVRRGRASRSGECNDKVRICSFSENRVAIIATLGKTTYTIALAADAIPAEKTAAQELQKYLQQVTSAEFFIEPETAVAQSAPQILIANGTRAKKLLARGAASTRSVGEDGIVIKTIGAKTLILSGDRPRGTLSAVFQVLEDAVGIRWWTPTENFVPRQSDLKIPAQNVAYTPPFRYREHFANSMQTDPVFATILRENGNFQTQSADVVDRQQHQFSLYLVGTLSGVVDGSRSIFIRLTSAPFIL